MGIAGGRVIRVSEAVYDFLLRLRGPKGGKTMNDVVRDVLDELSDDDIAEILERYKATPLDEEDDEDEDDDDECGDEESL